MPKQKRKRSRCDFVIEDISPSYCDVEPVAKRSRPWRSGMSEQQSGPVDVTIQEMSSNTSTTTPNAGKIFPYHVDSFAKTEIIPMFDPEKSMGLVKQWINKIEQLAVIHNWADHTKSYIMQARLGGMARTWHASLPHYNLSWEEWKNELLQAFPCNVDYVESLREMLSMKKNINDSMAQYFYQKNALLTRLDISGDRAVACLIDGLPMHMKAPARAGNYSTPTELYAKFLVMMEVKSRPPQAHVAPGKVYPGMKDTVFKDTQRKPPTCFLCNEPGHVVRRCPKNSGRILCTNCNRIGHNSEKCWFKSEAVNPPLSNTSVNVISTEVNDTYFMHVFINNVKVRAYFDSGAKINVANMDMSNQLGLPLLPCSFILQGFGGANSIARGQHEVTIRINDILFQTSLVIVDFDHKHPKVILGQPIINDPRISFTVNGNTLKIEECKKEQSKELLSIDDIQTVNHVRLYSARDTVIPPQTTSVVDIDFSSTNDDETIFVNSRDRFYNNIDFSIPASVVNRSSGVIGLCNRSEVALEIKKGTLLARGEKCVDIDLNKEDITLEPKQILRIDPDSVNCDATDPSIKTKLLELLKKYSDCFSSQTEELGCTDKIKMKIELNSDKPVFYRPYRLSEAEKLIVRDKISDLTKNNIIRESNSPFSSPIVLVKKKDGDYRLCIDYRKLNHITVKDRYPLPIIEEQIEKLGSKRVFTSLDMSQGFYQIPLEEESIPMTAFSTPEGHYEFLRMPFGLANSPSVYQRLMDRILGSLRHEKVLPYMDDLLIATPNEEEALETLRIVLDIVRDAKLTLNLSKCRFLQKEIQYLGYDISESGVRPGMKKIEAVMNYKEPSNVHELRMFLGLTSYFRKFVKGYALIAFDLYKLLKKDEQFVWDRSQQEAFDKLKRILSTRPVLALYNPKAETEVHTDASSKGIAGILLQKNGDKMKPVAYFSRKASREESFYHSYELESLAVVESLRRFRIYLAGITFKVVTDCAAVRQTFEKRDLLPRIARWWLSIQEYNFTIIHRPGKTHKHVDALSRAPVEEPQPIDILVLDLLDWVVCMQNQDPKLCIIREKLELKVSDPDIQNNYTLQDNKVFRKCSNNQLRLVVPKYCRWNIMRKYHDDIGHPGLKKCETLVKENCWFPSMTRFIRKYVNGCLDCAFKRGQYGKLEGELHPIEKASKPLDTLHIDHAGPFCKSKKGNSYLLVVVDSFTKFVWAKPSKTTKSGEVVEKLLGIFSEFGYPRRIISDRGSSFTSKTFRDFCISNHIEHVKNAVACPRANGQVERFNRTLIEAINKSTKDERLWDSCLGKVTWGINNTINSTIGHEPYRLMFHARRNIPLGFGNDELESEQSARDNVLKAHENIRKNAAVMKKRFDGKRKRPTQYKQNDLVLWKKSESGDKNVRRKLKEQFSGPYKVIKILGNDRYVITALKGLKGYKKFSAVVASDVLRKFVNESDSTSETDDSNIDSTEELMDLLEG